MKPLALTALLAILSTAAFAEEKPPKPPDTSISINEYIATLSPGDKLSSENAVLASLETARRLWGVKWKLRSAENKDGQWTVKLTQPEIEPAMCACTIVLTKWGLDSATFHPGRITRNGHSLATP